MWLVCELSDGEDEESSSGVFDWINFVHVFLLVQARKVKLKHML